MAIVSAILFRRSSRPASFLNTATASTFRPPSNRPPSAARYCSSSTETLVRELSPSPLLMYPTPIKVGSDGETEGSYRLYSLIDQTVRRLPVRIPYEILQMSPLGPCSINTVASISRHDCSMFVYHPFIQAIFFLPPFETLPFVTRKHRSTWLGKYKIGYILDGNESCSYANDLISESFVKKIILVSRMCFVICGPKREVAYCCRGDSTWRDFGGLIPGNYQYCDIVHFKNQIYYALARSSDGESYSVLRWDFRTWASTVVLTNVHPPFPNKRYLVKSGEDILMIVRYFCNPKKTNFEDENAEDNSDVIVRKSFDVYKFDFEKSSWELVNSIGDYALFLGPNCSAFSLPTSSYPGLTKDCIYFIIDKIEEYSNTNKNVKVILSGDEQYFGIFNIGDNSIKLCSTSVFFPKSDHQSPFWVVLDENVKKAFNHRA